MSMYAFSSIPASDFNIRLGKKIRKQRKAKGLTSMETARAIGVSSPSVTNWETGLNRPDIPNLLRLCEVLDITLHDLFDYSGNLTDEQASLLTLYDKLTKENQQNILSFMNVLLDRQPVEKE
ncbi:MAG: helix-turn-helix transcriptional regulator [Clostridia bacterium]|nr:helix-turn-helix transcriptional regulator [Clostridia bacterium]